MPTTSNFGWTTPADTDLVKDGAAAIRTLGNGIDTSFIDLKGGTTGQVLAKASNTDLDFSWVAQDDSNAIQNALLTTTGDTIYASAASSPARLGIGSTGQVLTVSGGVPVWATPASGSTFAGCYLGKSSSQSLNNSTDTAITFDQEDLDTDGYHSTVTNTSRITIPAGKGGKYLVIWQLQYDVNGTGRRNSQIWKNGSQVAGAETVANSVAYPTTGASTILSLAATDYIEVYGNQTSGGALSVVGTGSGRGSFFGAFLIGA